MILINKDEIRFVYAPIAPVLVGDKEHYENIAFQSEIEKLPTVDAVPVVLCKNCKWYGNNWVSRMGKVCMNSRLKTGYGTLWVEDDFYCGYGEEHGVE